MISAVESLENTLRGQSGRTVTEIEHLEDYNKAAARRYSAMNEAAGGLTADAEFLQQNSAEIAKYIHHVEDLSAEVSKLEALVKQMDEWSRELAVKVKRLN